MMAGFLCMGSNADFVDFFGPSGWMNVYDLDYYYQFGSSKEVITTDDRTFELLPDTSLYTESVPAGTYWVEGLTYFERQLVGDETQVALTFTVDANDLDPSYEVKGFIEVYDPYAPWAPAPSSDMVIPNGESGGTYTVSLPLDAGMAGMALQVGFVMEGLNASPTDDWGSVTVTATALTIPEPASLGLIGLVTGGIYFVRRIFIT